MTIQIHNHSVLTIAQQPSMVPTLILNALAEDWAEIASAVDIAIKDGEATLLSQYGTDRLWAAERDHVEPSGWWARFALVYRNDAFELRDRLHGQAYDVNLLCLFLLGRIAPDAFDSPEVLAITQAVHESFYGCSWPTMPGAVA